MDRKCCLDKTESIFVVVGVNSVCYDVTVTPQSPLDVFRFPLST